MTNIEKARQLTIQRERLAIMEEQVRKRLGIQITKALFLSDEAYSMFLNKLLCNVEKIDTRVDTSGVIVIADQEYRVMSGALVVDVRDPIEKIFAFLKE